MARSSKRARVYGRAEGAGPGQVGLALLVTGVAAGHRGHVRVLARQWQELAHVLHHIGLREQKVEFGQTLLVAFELLAKKGFHAKENAIK